MYKFRIKIFLAIVVLAFAGLAGRLWYLQVAHGRQYRTQAEVSQQTTEILQPSRGTILDRHSKILAFDEGCHNFCLDYGFIVQDPRWVRQQVKRISLERKIPRPQAQEAYDRMAENTWALAGRLATRAGEDLTQVCDRIRRRVEFLRNRVGMDVREQREAHPIVAGIEEEEYLGVVEQMNDTVGATVSKSFKRKYPYGALGCHIIGLTGQVTEDEQNRLNIADDEAGWLDRMLANYRDGDVIGKSGVEKMCEKTLRGQRGYQEVQRGGEVLDSHPAVAGRDVRLTIDIDLQARLGELLTSRGHTGSVVVISVATGEVLAMVSVPGYDLNTYRRQYSQMVHDDVNFPLLHRAVARCYPPGSTVKPVSALAGLGSGAIGEHTLLHCRGHYLESDPTHFRCWLRTGHGELGVTPALKQSCNCFFYEVGHRLGNERISEWFKQFGFAGLPGTGLPEEAAGTLPTSETVRHRYNRAPVPSDAWLTAIGQGPITATPLQVANAMATIARGGEFRSPVVADAGPVQTVRRLAINASHLQAVKDGMFAVVNEPGGTAYKTFNELTILEDKICGKTGTAQAPPVWKDVNGNNRMDENEIIRQGDMAWFAGFAPYHNPKIALVVLVEYVTTGGGGSNAGPLAHDLVQICRDMGYMQ